MKNSKKAFSIVEIIIAISIIVLLAVIGLSSKQGYDENMNNTKIISDTETINNALESYKQENSALPMPKGNTNFFAQDTSYSHSYDDPNTYGVYGSLTEETLAKKYLDALPLDPRTNSYYAYGKTKATNEFEIASVQIIDGSPIAKVVGNYTAETGPYNLIREYNGSNFVYNGSKTNLPYNPDELVMIVTDENGVVYREGETITVAIGNTLEIFFSDGSVSVLGNDTEETTLTLNSLNFKSGDNLNTLVKLALGAGTIWTKATHLNDDSEFEIYTTDSTAAVRGTIFGIKKDADTEVLVIEGEVGIYENVIETEIPETILDEENPVKIVKAGENIIIGSTYPISYTNTGTIDPSTITIPEFSLNTEDPRDGETTSNITENIDSTASCLFSINGTCIDHEADSSLTASGYNLVAYAPYDENLNLYTNTGIFTGLNQSLGDCDFGIDTNFENICSTDDINGISIDNTGELTGVDYLKYEGLDSIISGTDFAIEMSVKGSDLKRTSVSDRYFLFQDNEDSSYNTNFKLNIYDGELQFGTLNGTSNCTINIDLQNLINSDFYKIIAKKDGSELTLSIVDRSNNEITANTGTSTKTLYENLYIGSSKQPAFQWNGIIDYVKIYNK